MEHVKSNALRDVLTDPITLKLLQPPLVVASDGYTYNLNSLRVLMQNSFWKTSPKTGEVLRALAYPAPDTETLIRNVSEAVRRGEKTPVPTPSRACARAPLSIYDRTTAVYALPNDASLVEPHAACVTLYVNVVHCATTARVARLLSTCGLDSEPVVCIRVPLYCRPGTLPTIMTPPPESLVTQLAAEFAVAAGVSKMFQNPEHLATCLLVRHPGDDESIEDLYIRCR